MALRVFTSFALCTVHVAESIFRSMSRAIEKGRDAMEEQLWFHNPTLDSNSDLVAELSGKNRGHWNKCARFFAAVVFAFSFLVVCYFEGTDLQDLDFAERDFSLNETTSMNDTEIHAGVLAEQLLPAKEMHVTANNPTDTAVERMETTLQNLVLVLEQLEQQLDGRDLRATEEYQMEPGSLGAEGLLNVTPPFGRNDIGVHARPSTSSLPAELAIGTRKPDLDDDATKARLKQAEFAESVTRSFRSAESADGKFGGSLEIVPSKPNANNLSRGFDGTGSRAASKTPKPLGFSPHQTPAINSEPLGFSPHQTPAATPEPLGFSPHQTRVMTSEPLGFSPRQILAVTPETLGFSPPQAFADKDVSAVNAGHDVNGRLGSMDSGSNDSNMGLSNRLMSQSEGVVPRNPLHYPKGETPHKGTNGLVLTRDNRPQPVPVLDAPASSSSLREPVSSFDAANSPASGRSYEDVITFREHVQGFLSTWVQGVPLKERSVVSHSGNWSGIPKASSDIDYNEYVRIQGMFRRLQDRNMHKRSEEWSARSRRREERRKKKNGSKGRPTLIRQAARWVFGIAGCVLLLLMNPGFHRHGGGSHPRNHSHIGDAGPPFVGTATLKVPPTWSIERAHTYTLRCWVSDLILWASATDLEQHRQGPIAALQVSGSARELIREIPPDQLANGVHDPQTGQHISGLMVLVRTLARRYSPLEGEASTRAVSDFLNFARMPGESVDAFLVRFDILRNRAHMRAGLGVNHQGLAWLLLRAVGVNVEQMERLLQPRNGNLPGDDAQFNALLERIRRQGHLYEGGMRHPTQQAGTGDPGMYHFYPTFGGNSSSSSGNQSGGTPAFNTPQSFPGPSWASGSAGDDLGMYVGGPGAMWGSGEDECCEACGMYYDDGDISSATETDTGSYDEGIRSYQVVDVDGEERVDATARQNAIYQDYLLARRRWRRFTGKPPRRYRKMSYKPGRFIPKLKSGPYSRSYATFLPPTAFAGGKGARKGQGKGFPRKNPRGKDGQVLKCAKCGSDEHLWRKCPQVLSKGQGKGAGVSSHHAASMPAESQHVPASLALTTMPAVPSVETWHTGVASGMMPGVSFHYMGTPRPASEVSYSGGSQRETALDDELARLESVSQFSTRSKKSRKSEDESRSPPQWTPFESPKASASASDAASVGDVPNSSIESLRPGVAMPKYPPPTAQGPTEEEIARQRTVLQLHTMLLTWWESEGRTFNVSAQPSSSECTPASMYHLKTRLEGNRPGLLVDPGAHDNLVGAKTAERMQQIVGTSSKKLRMDKSLSVEGVGKSAQVASTAQRLALRLQTDEGESVSGTYTAPTIEDSELPPLLGLRSLKGFKAILDMGSNKLIIPGPAGCEIQRSPGTVAYDLEVSDSGHLILPIDQVSNSGGSRVHQSRLDFAMSCRKGDRSNSPAPITRNASPEPAKKSA